MAVTGAPELLDLPTDRPRPATQTFQGGSVCIPLPPGLETSPKRLSRQEGSTLFMTLLAAFNVLLFRYTRQTDILVGSPIAGRTQIETEELIGFFVNTLVLRNDLSGNPTFRELLSRVKNVALGAYGHQDLPFEKLVQELQPERNLSHSPLFQVMFVWQNLPPLDQADLHGLRVRSLPRDVSTVKFDLTLTMGVSGEELAGFMDYSTELFKDATVRQMLRHFERVLEQFAAGPEQRLSEIDLLSEQERALVLMDWSKKANALLEDAETERLLAEIEQMETDDLNELMKGSH